MIASRSVAAIAALLALIATPGIAHAQTAAPAKSAKKPARRLHVDGYVRQYYFTKQQASSTTAAGVKSLPQNQAATNTGILVRATYDLTSHFSATAGYYGVDAFNANGPCSHAPNYAIGGACTPAMQAKIDNTLPGFGLSTLGEAYLRYHTAKVNIAVGNQKINTPWAQPIDGRMKPNFFQGLSSNFDFAPNLSLTVDRIVRFESRTSSSFLPTTFVTKPTQFVSGALYTALKYSGKHRPVTGMVGLYNFYNIANLVDAEGRTALGSKSRFAPYLQAQYIRERNAGLSYAGLVDNSTLGFAIGATAAKNVTFSYAIDDAPWRSMTVTAASLAAATASSHVFLPTGGSPAIKANGNGTYTLYYGGIASPYTGAYAGDGLFTSIPTASMAQRQSAGASSKATINYHSNNRRLQTQLAFAQFNFTNGAGVEKSHASLLQATYYFGKPKGKSFDGFSIEDRYIERTQTNVAQFGGVPLLIYNRLQLQYSF